MSWKQVLGWRVKLTEPTPSGQYVAAESGTWTLSHDPPRPVSYKRAVALCGKAAKWNKWASAGRGRWVPVWSVDDLRIVKVVRKGGAT